jgi:hypothetical protein
MTNTQYIVIKDRECGWSIFNTITRTIVEGGFSSRSAAMDYLNLEYTR